MAAPLTTRIAICGAGISGLTLAGILSRRLGAAGQITVFERAPIDRDEGYGLDLDEQGQEALARAGVYDRFWEMARPRSDAGMAFYQAQAHGRGISPFLHVYQPRWLQRLFPGKLGARPECNREKLRDVLLDALRANGNAQVLFETATGDIKEIPPSASASASGGGLSGAELFDREGGSLGEYNLVVDAMGLHSPLRHLFVDDPAGKLYEGYVMIHGSIHDPDEIFSEEMLRRFAPFGTAAVAAKGVQFFMQRFGAGPADNRSCLFYNVPWDRADGDVSFFAEELGIEKPSSRRGGIMADKERLGKVKAWIKNHMRGLGMCPIWEEAVEGLDRVKVRGSVTHGHTELKSEPVTLPLIAIGDSLRNCGIGGGGILAMQDAIELSKLLAPDAGGEAEAGAVFCPETGHADPAPLRKAAEVMLKRKTEFMEDKKEKQWMHERRKAGDERGPDFTWDDMLEHNGFVVGHLQRIFLPWVQWLSKRSYAADLARGEAGSTKENSLVYSNVTAYLEKEKEEAAGKEHRRR